MNDLRRNYGATTARADGRAIDEGLRQYMLGVYNYMAMAVAGTGLVSLAVASNPSFVMTVAATPLKWVLFAAILGINRIFLPEREEGGFDAFRLAPVDRPVLFAAKAAVLFLYLAVLEVIVVPVFAVFFLQDWGGLIPLVLVLLATNLGFAALGTLISSMAVNSRARDLLVPLLLLPLVVPLMIAATGATSPLLDAGGPSYDKFGTWLLVLGLYDGVFCLVGYAVFDFLLED